MPNADVKTGAPLCRAQNPELEIVKKFLFAMPHIAMDKKEYDAITESKFSGWTGTHYQMAKQMALYFTKDGLCIPRFQENVTTSDIVAYMCEWAKKYYAPNPFTKDLNKYDDLKPVVLYAYFSDCIHKGITSYKDACESLFEGIQLNNMDKVKLMLNSFTDIYIDSNGLMTFQQYATPQELVLTPDIENYLDEESFFNYFSTPNSIQVAKTTVKDWEKTPTIQKIYYGCPGTGKSREVKRLTEGLKGEQTIVFDDGTTNIFRTTFHPDYDYTTFVGCYKPVKNAGTLDYKFVPQVFTNAYVAAKKHPETPIYLIIEEINRGNCAQIFGDLFQLLDRKNGVSEFPIDTEEELMKYLRDEAGIEDCKKLCLPANFNIYATMNTSDQSLFPMDSAFKRRWEMKYVKINYDIPDADFTFSVNGTDYHWVYYLPFFNDKITEASDSEDKQMGEFFIRKNMTSEEFKNKVMFYLWNDVCKDLYAGNNSPQSFFFRDLYGKPFKFTQLFNEPKADASDEEKNDPYKNGDVLLAQFLYYIEHGKKKSPKAAATPTTTEGEETTDTE